MILGFASVENEMVLPPNFLDLYIARSAALRTSSAGKSLFFTILIPRLAVQFISTVPESRSKEASVET